MRAGVPRLAPRLMLGFSQGALLAVCLWLAAPATALQITDARYTDPTDRYAHGILGDAIEYGTLELTLSDRTRRRIVLPETLVFEDVAPRLVDVDGDGKAEVITVESSLELGARLAIHDENGRIAATPHIGKRNRWLAPIGAADLDGDGHIEIAYIDRPHLKKTLRIWRFRNGTLEHADDRPGLTNHKIGWNFIPGGIRTCDEVPEMIVAMHNWKLVLAVKYRDGKFSSYAAGVYRGPKDLDAALVCLR